MAFKFYATLGSNWQSVSSCDLTGPTMTMTFPHGFLWGASTAPHQTEGNNLNSERRWARERLMPGGEPGGDACDSYHRYPEDMRLLAESGLKRLSVRCGMGAHRTRVRRVLKRRTAPLPPHDRLRSRAGDHAGRHAAPLHQSAVVRSGRWLAQRLRIESLGAVRDTSGLHPRRRGLGMHHERAQHARHHDDAQ